jgi:hypothetical protein
MTKIYEEFGITRERAIEVRTISDADKITIEMGLGLLANGAGLAKIAQNCIAAGCTPMETAFQTTTAAILLERMR